MPQEWIEALADEIKRKHSEAAEEYRRQQHRAGVIADEAKPFFVSLVQSLQQNIDALRNHLQGDLTASDTGLQTVRACEIKITRARFPWVDATLEHHGASITLDYARCAGTPDPAEPRKQATYAFRVAPDDSLYAQDTFSAEPADYHQPEELARRITEILFAP